MAKIITISREYASGGRLIGKEVAKQLGWKFIDSEIIAQVAKESGFTEEFVEQSGEYASATTSLLFNLSLGANPHHGIMSLYNEVFNIQRGIIEKAADEGNCVIVGRCADYILREREDCLNVFIHAPIESRVKRMTEDYGHNEKHPEKYIAEMDKKRKVYCQNFTGTNWGSVHNYHLTLDSDYYGIQKCAEIIVSSAK